LHHDRSIDPNTHTRLTVEGGYAWRLAASRRFVLVLGGGLSLNGGLPARSPLDVPRIDATAVSTLAFAF
jgi:hypothetical protein